MSKLYDALCQSEKANAPVQRFEDNSLPGDGGRHRMDLRGPHLQETVKLVQRVFVFPDSHAPKVVVFSSVNKDNSSSEICSRAGQVLATQVSGQSAWWTQICTSPHFTGCSGSAGSPDLRTRRSDRVQLKICGTNRRWKSLAGAVRIICREPPEFFASDRLGSRMLELRKEFDHVLIDASSVSSSADAILLGQMAEGVILVVEANSTRRETARIAKGAFEGAKVRLLGAILNNRTFPIPEALYRRL